MPLRLYRAWRLYTRLNYSWHLAWHKAAYQQPAVFVMRPTTLVSIGHRRVSK